MSEKRKANETREEKRARLQRELAELRQEQEEKNSAIVAERMQVFFTEPSRLAKIVTAIGTQLKFTKVELMDDLSSHLHDAEQNCRCGDAVRLEFEDISSGRRYACALTASNLEHREHNRAELRLLTRNDDGYDRKAVKPMLIGFTDTPSDVLCMLAESAGGNEYTTRFTAAMLPFQGEVNLMLTLSPEALRLFDIALFAHTIDAARTHADAMAALSEGNTPDYHRIIDLAIENISAYAK